MNFGEVIRIVARRWLLIAGCALVGLLISGLLVFKIGSGGITPRKSGYTSSAKILLDQPKLAGTAATAALGRLLTLPTTYVEIIQSDEIAQRASQKLNGVYSPEDIAACTGAESQLGTQVMSISSCGDNPSDAQAVTIAVVDSLKEWLDQRQDDSGTLGANRLTISVISAPQIPKSPSGFPPAIWVMVGGFLGLVVGLLVAFGMESVQAAGAPEAPAVAALPTNGAPPAFAPGQPAPIAAAATAQGARLRRPRRGARSY